jgi:hypothetical protein
MTESDFRRRGARNAEQTGNYGIKGKFGASDTVTAKDTQIRGEAVVAVGEFK